MTVDNESPPGSWKNEMERAPWAYGQKQVRTHEYILDRKEQELRQYRRENQYLREVNERYRRKIEEQEDYINRTMGVEIILIMLGVGIGMLSTWTVLK